jgi:hypothetical protein
VQRRGSRTHRVPSRNVGNSDRLRGALLDRIPSGLAKRVERPFSIGYATLFNDADDEHQDAFFVALAGYDEGLADVGFDF